MQKCKLMLLIFCIFISANISMGAQYGSNNGKTLIHIPSATTGTNYNSPYSYRPNLSTTIYNTPRNGSISQQVHNIPQNVYIPPISKTNIIRTNSNGTQTITQYYNTPYNMMYYPYTRYYPSGSYYRTQTIYPVTTTTTTTKYNTSGGTITQTFTEEYSPYYRTIRY